ncbi:hypothetical protein ACRAKI_12590 [Saccharothrix isguenensis]
MRKVPRNRGGVWLAGIGAAVGAGVTAYAWPLGDDSVDHEFFLGVAGAALTALGLIFSVTILMTDLGQARARLEPRRVFTSVTWAYLAVFLGSVGWTLWFAFFAGVSDGVDEVCFESDGGWCVVNERQAARISVFLIALALTLLLPFVRYAYLRISPKTVFEGLARRAVYARDSEGRRSGMSDYRRLAVSFAGDPDRNVLFVALKALGSVSRTALAKDPRAGGDLLEQVCMTIGEINRSTRISEVDNRVVLDFAAVWLDQVAESVGVRTGAGRTAVNRKVAIDSGRRLLDLASANLRAWNDGELSNRVGFGTFSLVGQVAEVCLEHGMPMSFVAVAGNIRACVEHRVSDSTGRVVYGCLRALLLLARQTYGAKVELGGSKVTIELLLTLDRLSTASDRPPIPVWTLRELADFVVVVSTGGTRLRNSAIARTSALQLREIATLADHLARSAPDRSDGLAALLLLFRHLIRNGMHAQVVEVGVPLILRQLEDRAPDLALVSFEALAESVQHCEDVRLGGVAHAARKLAMALRNEQGASTAQVGSEVFDEVDDATLLTG